MRYLIALLVPPLAVLLCGRPLGALLNLLLTLCCWVPGVIHAMAIVHEKKADERAAKYRPVVNVVQNAR